VGLLIATTGLAQAGKDNDTLVWSTSTEMDTPDIYYQNLREVVILSLQQCDSLLHRDPKSGEYQPSLASSYKWLDDTTLDVKLRHGVKFHNGQELTANDVAYTLIHAAKPDSGVVTRTFTDWIKDVQVVAPDEVHIQAKSPTPAALEYLSDVTPIYPAGHYDKAPTVPGAKGATRRDWGAVRPMCTGPYILKDFVPGSSATLVKNPDYFKDSPKGQPHIGKLVFRTIPDVDTQVAALITGDVDWIWGVPPENADALRNEAHVTVKSAPTTRLSFLSLDAAGRSGKNPMQDVRVRQAIAYAIDRNAIVKNLVGGGGEVVDSMCYPTQFGCTTDVKKYPYDPAKAKQLLAEAGYPNGFKVPFYAYRDQRYSEAVLNYLRQVGIVGDLRFLQWKALRPVMQQGKAEMAQLTWGSQGIQDASASTSYYFEGSSDDYARDPQVESWLKAADTTIDPAKRKELYKKALSRIADQAYFVPLFAYGRTYAFDSDLDYPVTSDELAHFDMAKWT
jgi:peptide/nickel transport system substrate-binding protein